MKKKDQVLDIRRVRYIVTRKVRVRLPSGAYSNSGKRDYRVDAHIINGDTTIITKTPF